MSPEQKAALREAVDNIVRDEAYDGGYGTLSEDQFNKMAARIAGLVMEEVEERL